MSRERDTDTLTRIDLGPDAPTVKNSTGDDAETHKLDPRAYAPLRVCPQCSLAWEVTGKWCPSCGTAFDKTARESVRATRVMPARSVSPAPARAQPPLTRSARRRGAVPPPPAPTAAASARSGGAGKVIFTVMLFAAAIAVAFFVGQSTRPSEAQVDKSINQSVQAAKQSAVESYGRAFKKMQAQAAAAIEAARAKALAEGEAKAQADRDTQSQNSIFNSVTECVLHGNC